jgi:hypothetical protein
MTLGCGAGDDDELPWVASAKGDDLRRLAAITLPVLSIGDLTFV